MVIVTHGGWLITLIKLFKSHISFDLIKNLPQPVIIHLNLSKNNAVLKFNDLL